MRAACTRFLSEVRWRTRCRRHRDRSRSARTAGVGSQMRAPGHDGTARPAPTHRSCRSCRRAAPGPWPAGHRPPHGPPRQLELVVHEAAAFIDSTTAITGWAYSPRRVAGSRSPRRQAKRGHRQGLTVLGVHIGRRQLSLVGRETRPSHHPGTPPNPKVRARRAGAVLTRGVPDEPNVPFALRRARMASATSCLIPQLFVVSLAKGSSRKPVEVGR